MTAVRASRYGARGKLRGKPAAGSFINMHGYRTLTGQYGHPLADKYHKVKENRKVLYDAIGPGPHACHWGCGKTDLMWDGDKPGSITADHLNSDRLDNRPENLVPSCKPCNTARRHAGNPTDWRADQPPERCKYGHDLTGDNLRVQKSNGRRICRQCERDWKAATKARLGGSTMTDILDLEIALNELICAVAELRELITARDRGDQ